MSNDTIWAPAEPQIIVSGKYAQQQKYWESLLYIDPAFLLNKYRQLKLSFRKLDDYEWHIVWLWEEARNLVSRQTCQFCNYVAPIAFFLVSYEENGRKSLILRSQTCCASKSCQAILERNIVGSSDRYPLRFESFGEPLFRKNQRNKMALKELFAWSFGIKNKGRFGAQDVFDVIHEQWQGRQTCYVATNPFQMSLML